MLYGLSRQVFNESHQMTRARKIIRTATPAKWRNRLVGCVVLLFALGLVVWLLGVSFEGAARTVALLTAIGLGAWGIGRIR